uniref:EF-hand domain-containing protein n=1 Tax=Triparma pacifica TaxID=91992 RepID=A0A7S2VWM5_9STRA
MSRYISLLYVIFVVISVHGQQYDDYPADDNMYHDYAQKQQAKMDRAAGGGGMRTWLFAGLGGFVVGKLHSGRKVRSLKKQHAKEQKKLYTQYYNDVYKMQEQINEYAYQAEHYKSVAVQVQESAELDAMQRDYDEFKQPDIDGDDRISRAEFNMYVKNYLSNYPGLAEKDYPRFEDFDHDHDGYVSFSEYSQQMALQVQQAEWEAYYGNNGGAGGGGNQNLANALKGLSGETKKANNFNDLYAGYR